MAQSRILSHLPSSCSQGQSPHSDLQPPPAAFPGFPLSFLGTLVMLEGPELSSLFQQPGHPWGARYHPNTGKTAASGMAESSAKRIHSQNYPKKTRSIGRLRFIDTSNWTVWHHGVGMRRQEDREYVTSPKATHPGSYLSIPSISHEL